MRNREAGYYWVRKGEDWFVYHWSALIRQWTCHGLGADRYDSGWDEIVERRIERETERRDQIVALPDGNLQCMICENIAPNPDVR